MSKGSVQTWERIVDGALIALARRGRYKFSMTDVCTESGVSRGTLYRYFADKEDVIAAVEERLETSFRDRLTTAIAERPEPADRLEVVGAAIVQHQEEFPALALLVRTEPGVVLERMSARFDALVALMQECLHPALTQAEQVQNGTVSEEQIARIVVHCGISLTCLPPNKSSTAEEVTASLEGLLSLGSSARESSKRHAN
ncbi:TetR/AcrR family transcriptional regulator [Nocardioides massiliensis]|uniref:AcrR family transcriptional regulator n=1 Tax=Nocardioides massiliensis TaxID=1325935 RepID=A0ABT9NK52_9ACTN|nr:TetR/AcrR family transcriptional regulator [Nocardioides massiliensis]MDP9820796.1 AcrR family transcriptional regulator [Nocardioides massiliensis]